MNTNVSERTKETQALIEMLALGRKQIAEGKVIPLSVAIAQIKKRRRSAQCQ